MNIDNVAEKASKAMTLYILRVVEDGIKALRPDTSALAPEHVTGFEAGFKAAKHAMFDMLAED